MGDGASSAGQARAGRLRMAGRSALEVPLPIFIGINSVGKLSVCCLGEGLIGFAIPVVR